ncbi:sulfite exporter TauE/SafE family protein [Oricola cellulosilytica]|uniref:Probable membrane transporter protein n=1 Tax=Oricola cellulosilytica TaxID=1429082 RepID=A0A4R0P3N4_9HYPH|nr:sulfite exporter TauE/SafE family protein [Oricola cellulosilytica]TCD11441.1 sulfite exporter TauE/SafE family protein [Oricola cellulosilytica]
MPLITDPVFYALAVPAVIFVGMSKGGFGGAMALLGVPMMALVVSPVAAAAIMLPILIVMDMVGLWTWRGHFDRQTLKIMLPAGVLGIGIGWLTAAWVTADHVRLLVGIVALAFVADYVRRRMKSSPTTASPHNPVKGGFWGTIAGFTSFVSHAGGPPYQFYTLPLGQDPKLFTGTSVVFFAVINAVKLIPYFALGQFDATNLGTSAVLMPIAPLATIAGAWLVKRMNSAIFYPFMYAMVMFVGIKLVYDGLAAIMP